MTAVCLMFLKLPAFRSLFPDVSDLYYLTVFFVIIIFMGIFTSFCVRTDRINLLSGISKNPAFILIMALASAVQSRSSSSAEAQYGAFRCPRADAATRRAHRRIGNTDTECGKALFPQIIDTRFLLGYNFIKPSSA